MRFCTECGAQVSEQAKFCKECGSLLNQAEKRNKSTTDTSTDESGVLPYKINQEIMPGQEGSSFIPEARRESAATAASLPPVGMNQGSTSAAVSVRMSLKQKIFILSGVLLLAVLVGGYKAGQYFTSEDRLISRLEAALESKDAKAVAELLSSRDEKLKVDEKSITGFMKYLDHNPNESSQIIGLLKEQAEVIEKAAQNQSFEDLYGGYGLNGLINLEKSGKTLFFDTYSLTMGGVYLEVETNYAGTVLSVNGQQAAVADVPDYETTLGPYLPGIYDVEARFKNEFIDLKTAEEIELLDTRYSYREYLELEGETVSWSTRFMDEPELDGRLYINGKKVEVDPFANSEFGPVTTDGSMTLAVEADFPWGTVRSTEVKIDENYIVIDFTQDEGFRKTIQDTVIKHSKENLEAFVSGNADKLTLSTDKYKDVLQSVVNDFKESGYAYKSNYLGTIFDKGSMDLDYRNGVWEMTLVTQPLIEAATFIEGESPSLEMQEAYSYTGLVYDEDQKSWKVDYISNTWGFDTDELEEYKEEKPVTYESAWGETPNIDI
ncbi:zinc ribbon domain-containing protein [Paenibacillus dakarensis]|uniref:zinc ribbon domain-containing protein n=1 Tax=Paenibacillus dakarensis TaxID=1527293 RepID=UPI0006D5B396|nr:zinc-ribbon domain-containing protein [Paenibacillus dakarensis]